MRYSCLLLALLALATTPAVFAEDGAGSSGTAVDLQDLQKAIPHGISLLEKEDYQTFLKTFVEPDQLGKATKGKTLEEFSASFATGKAKQLLAVLKATRGLQPKTEKGGEIVIYTIPEEAAKAAAITKREIAFVRVDKRWYIHN